VDPQFRKEIHERAPKKKCKEKGKGGKVEGLICNAKKHLMRRTEHWPVGNADNKRGKSGTVCAPS